VARQVYRYCFTDQIDLQEVEETLLLAFVATEGIHDQTQVQLDGGYYLDKATRTVVVNTSTKVGQDVAGIFTRLLTCEFGPDSFHVSSVESKPGRPCGEDDR